MAHWPMRPKLNACCEAIASSCLQAQSAHAVRHMDLLLSSVLYRGIEDRLIWAMLLKLNACCEAVAPACLCAQSAQAVGYKEWLFDSIANRTAECSTHIHLSSVAVMAPICLPEGICACL